MSQLFIDKLRTENLCTYYVLPLLKLSKLSFSSSNFVNCYLTDDGSKVVVKIVEPLLLATGSFNHPLFMCAYKDTDSHTYLVYNIPLTWRNDILAFMQGKYSMFSERAKESIIRFSGLANNELVDGKPRTDGRLLALNKHPVLKAMWERELSAITGNEKPSLVELPEDMELLSIPGKESYINLDGLIQI